MPKYPDISNCIMNIYLLYANVPMIATRQENGRMNREFKRINQTPSVKPLPCNTRQLLLKPYLGNNTGGGGILIRVNRTPLSHLPGRFVSAQQKTAHQSGGYYLLVEIHPSELSPDLSMFRAYQDNNKYKAG
jgi:hypothetical protein